MNHQQQQIEKENYENYVNEINYYSRRSQKNVYDFIIERLSHELTVYNLCNPQDEEKKKKSQSKYSDLFKNNQQKYFTQIAELSRFTSMFSIQSYLLDNQLSVLLQNHPEYNKMKPDIDKYESALDQRAKAEIQNIYLQQALQNMDFLKKTDINTLPSEQKQ